MTTALLVLQAVTGIVMAAATLLLAALTFKYVRATREMVREMAEARLAQSRPQVFVDIETISSLMLVVLKSSGLTAAYDIEVAFDPPLIGQPLGPGGEPRDLGKLPMFRHTTYLAPGRRLPATFWVGAAFFGQTLPRIYGFKIQYRDGQGHEFSEEGTLDFEAMTDTRIDHNPVADSVDKLRDALVSGLARPGS